MLVFTITSLGDFEHLYKYVGRENDFSQDAKEAIFDYYKELDEDIEFEPILFVDEFTEYDDPWELINGYDLQDWYDSVDVHEVELTVGEWVDLVIDPSYLFSILPKDVCYYDEELEDYVVPDYSRKVRLDEMEDYYWLKMELMNHDEFEEILNVVVDNNDLLFFVAEELEDKGYMIWDLKGSILIMNQ